MKLGQDASFAMFANLLYLLTRLGLPPLILAHLSLAEYGLWAACFMLIGYIGLADFGFSAVYVSSTAKLQVEQNIAGISALLSTGIACMLFISSLLMLVVTFSMPMLLQALHVPLNLSTHTKQVILLCVAIFLFDMCFNAFAYVLHGLQHFRAEQKVWVATFSLEMLCIGGLLFAGLGIYALLLAFALRYAVAIACNISQVYRLLPGLHVGPRYFSTALIPIFFKRGMQLQASSFFAMALHSGDRLLAGIFLGPQAIAVFDLASKLPVSAASIPAAISHITFPTAARVVAQNHQPSSCLSVLQPLYLRTTRAVAMLAALPLAFLAAFAPLVCQVWLGPRAELAQLPTIMSLIAVASCFHISTGPGTAVFRAMGKMGNEFIYHFLRLAGIALVLATLYYLTGFHTVTLAKALCCASVIASLLYLLHNHIQFGLSSFQLLRHTLLPASSPFLLGFALALIWQMDSSLLLMIQASRLYAMLAILILGLVYLLLCGLIYWQFLVTEEKQHVVMQFQGIHPFFQKLLAGLPVAAIPQGVRHER